MKKPTTKPNSDAHKILFIRLSCVCLMLCLFMLSPTMAQTPPDEAQATGVVRLSVKPKGKEKGLPRKRFYLIKGSLEENKALVEKIKRQSFTTRACYYRNAKASEDFIKWLREGDCESVYCRPIEEKFLTGATAVPEFQKAYERGAQEYKKPELGRLWLTTNLTDEIRDGFYRHQQAVLKALISEAEAATKAPVISVLTDAKGTAYLTNLTPGTYLITNLLPTEVGDNLILWTSEVKVSAGDLKKPALIPNTNKNVKSDVIEIPVPACDANKQTTSKR